MLPPAQDYQDLYRRFRWQIPEYYNIGTDVCDKWAALDPNKLALIYVDQTGLRPRLQFRSVTRCIEPVGKLTESSRNRTRGSRRNFSAPVA